MYLVSEKELIGDSTLKMEIQKSNNIYNGFLEEHKVCVNNH